MRSDPLLRLTGTQGGNGRTPPYRLFAQRFSSALVRRWIRPQAASGVFSLPRL